MSMPRAIKPTAVRLYGEEDTAWGRVPAGTIIRHADAHWLVRLGKAEPVDEEPLAAEAKDPGEA